MASARLSGLGRAVAPQKNATIRGALLRKAEHWITCPPGIVWNVFRILSFLMTKFSIVPCNYVCYFLPAVESTSYRGIALSCAVH